MRLEIDEHLTVDNVVDITKVATAGPADRFPPVPYIIGGFALDDQRRLRYRQGLLHNGTPALPPCAGSPTPATVI